MKNILSAVVLCLVSFSAGAAGNVENGRKLATDKACISCHGADMNTPIDASYPKLAGQYPDYLVNAMLAYKRTGRSTMGRDNPVMAAQVQSLTTRDIADLAAYLGSLKGGMVSSKK